MGGLELLMVMTLALTLTAVAITFPNGVIPLERALPSNHKFKVEVLKARDRLRHAQMLQSSGSGYVNFSIAGMSDPFILGIYYAKIKLGSPPKEFRVQFDTGSDALWLACPNTTDLVDPKFYDAANSSTASSISCSDEICVAIRQGPVPYAKCLTGSNECGYSFIYGDQSVTSGHYVSDVLYYDMVMNSSSVVTSSTHVVFGCSTFQSQDLINEELITDGIFGFGQNAISVISQLSTLGITPKVFSHCLGGDDTGGGILVVGEILDPRIVYTPLVPSQPHYNLYMMSISVNGKVLPINPALFATSANHGTFIDSGTTLAYLPPEAHEQFINAITQQVWQSTRPVLFQEKQCYAVNASNNITNIFPPVVFNFEGGASMTLRPNNYLVPNGVLESGELWCNGFHKHELGLTVLGDLVLKDKIIVYDIAHQRVGWADYDCSMSVNVLVPSSEHTHGRLRGSSSPRLVLQNMQCLLFMMIGIGFLLL